MRNHVANCFRYSRTHRGSRFPYFKDAIIECRSDEYEQSNETHDHALIHGFVSSSTSPHCSLQKCGLELAPKYFMPCLRGRNTLLHRWRFVQTLSGLHQFMAGPEQLDLNCILVHLQHSGQFFHRIPFYFFQKEKLLLLVRHSIHELDDVVPARQRRVCTSSAIECRLAVVHAPHFVLAHIALVDELSHLLLTEIVETLVNGNLINPGDQRTAEIEVADGEIDLSENLLGDIFNVVPLPDDTVD